MEIICKSEKRPKNQSPSFQKSIAKKFEKNDGQISIIGPDLDPEKIEKFKSN